jgi:hypothetical protein
MAASGCGLGQRIGRQKPCRKEPCFRVIRYRAAAPGTGGRYTCQWPRPQAAASLRTLNDSVLSTFLKHPAGASTQSRLQVAGRDLMSFDAAILAGCSRCPRIAAIAQTHTKRALPSR